MVSLILLFCWLFLVAGLVGLTVYAILTIFEKLDKLPPDDLD